jgi:hypothetical protein
VIANDQGNINQTETTELESDQQEPMQLLRFKNPKYGERAVLYGDFYKYFKPRPESYIKQDNIHSPKLAFGPQTKALECMINLGFVGQE